MNPRELRRDRRDDGGDLELGEARLLRTLSSSLLLRELERGRGGSISSIGRRSRRFRRRNISISSNNDRILRGREQGRERHESRPLLLLLLSPLPGFFFFFVPRRRHRCSD